MYLHWPVTDWTTATTGANTAIPPWGGSATALLKAGRHRNPATLHALAALIYVPAASVEYRTFSSPFDICPLRKSPSIVDICPPVLDPNPGLTLNPNRHLTLTALSLSLNFNLDRNPDLKS